MPNLLLLFSHPLTSKQIKESKTSLQVQTIFPLPPNLLELWQDIPSYKVDYSEYLGPIKTWVLETGKKQDYILVQGDYGATYIMINFAFKYGFIPIFATSKRLSKDYPQKDGSVRIEKIFNHIKFREYELLL